MDLNHGSRSKLPQAPWVLYFDGASRKPAGHAGLGVVLKNSKGQVVEEERMFVGGGISSGLAKYKALLVGLKKAKSLQVKHLLVKGNSQLLINQVVGRWTVKDSHLRDHLKKVWVISKEFDSLFMEFIPKDQNVHTDRIANAAIDKELQNQEVVTEYFDRSSASPSSSPKIKEPVPISPRLTLSSNSKLRPVSPLPQHRPHTNKDITGASKPMSPELKTSAHVTFYGDDVQTSDSELTRTIKSLSTRKADRFWHGDPDRLSISDESSTTASEEGYFQSSVPDNTLGPATVAMGGVSGNESGEDMDEQEHEFCKPACAQELCTSVSVNVDRGSEVRSTIQLSEADCDRLVSAVIERLKKNKLGSPADD